MSGENWGSGSVGRDGCVLGRLEGSSELISACAAARSVGVGSGSM